jgi:hypothetical protein
MMVVVLLLMFLLFVEVGDWLISGKLLLSLWDKFWLLMSLDRVRWLLWQLVVSVVIGSCFWEVMFDNWKHFFEDIEYTLELVLLFLVKVALLIQDYWYWLRWCLEIEWVDCGIVSGKSLCWWICIYKSVISLVGWLFIGKIGWVGILHFFMLKF